MSDFNNEDIGDVSSFQKPGIHEEEISLLTDLIFGGWHPDNESDELFNTFDESEIRTMWETFKDPDEWIDSLMKSEDFKQYVSSEISRHVGALKYVIEKYYDKEDTDE